MSWAWKNECVACVTKHPKATRILLVCWTIFIIAAFFGLFAATLGAFKSSELDPPVYHFPPDSTSGRTVFPVTGKIVDFNPYTNIVTVSTTISAPQAWFDLEGRTIVPFEIWCGSTQHKIQVGWPAKNTFVDQLPTNGNILNYPYDAYTFTVGWAVYQTGNTTTKFDQDLRMTHNPIYGFEFTNTGTNGMTYSYFNVQMQVNRTTISKVYPTFIIIAFWTIILIIGYFVIAVVVWEARRVELPMLGIFPALLFALPAFRNTAPASPPIGCLLDFCSFFWAMLLAILSIIAIFGKFLFQAPAAPAAPPPPTPSPEKKLKDFDDVELSAYDVHHP